MAEPFTIYQITILYMLDKAGFPLTDTQFADFFLGRGYTDYFRLQEVLGSLVDSSLILSESSHSNIRYTLTDSGRNTLHFFRDKISEGIEADVRTFFDENKLEFKQDNSCIANYYLTTNHSYAVRCQVLSDTTAVIDLTLTVRTKEQAQTICEHWKKNSEDVYAYLMDILLK